MKPYEFDPKDLNKLIEQHAKIDPKTDIKEAKKWNLQTSEAIIFI